jgi:hypothetical protein
MVSLSEDFAMLRSCVCGGLAAIVLSSVAVAQAGPTAETDQLKINSVRSAVQQACATQVPLPMVNPKNPTPSDRIVADAMEKSFQQTMDVLERKLGAMGSTGFSTPEAATEFKAQLRQVVLCAYGKEIDKATQEAIRGGVGTEVGWKSETNPGISGRSKVTGEEAMADGGRCVTVTDVIIVEGEETTVPKRMCRAAGLSAYVKV